MRKKKKEMEKKSKMKIGRKKILFEILCFRYVELYSNLCFIYYVSDMLNQTTISISYAMFHIL